jgi:hypothetical protein
MKIYSIITDLKPVMCINCIIVNSCNKGIFKQKVCEHDGWVTGGTVPGPECPIKVKEAI